MVASLAQRLQLALARAPFKLPLPIVRRLAGRPKTHHGVELDPYVQLLLKMGEKRPGLEEYPPEKARKLYRTFCVVFSNAAPPVHSREDRRVGSIPVRIYRPKPGRLPVLLFIHGGGFVIGDIESYDPICAYLANAVGCAVVALDYRLAPEHPFPAAVEDCTAVYDWLRTEAEALDFDPKKILVGGDSAGGNLSAVVAQHARDTEGEEPIFQALIYPSTDTRTVPPSRTQLADGYGLTKTLMDWFHGNYAADDHDPRRSPAAGKLEGLCPAMVLTCGFDPLSDEGVAYADALERAKVPVQRLEYPDLHHGALSLARVSPRARKMLRDVADSMISSILRSE